MPPQLHGLLTVYCSVKIDPMLLLLEKCVWTLLGYQGKNGDAQIQGLPETGQAL